MMYRKVIVVGTGLIGGSIGKALIKKGLAREVVGVCRREVSAERALREKAVTSAVVEDYETVCLGADIIVIATPLGTIKEALDKLSLCSLSQDTLVTDAGSTKKDIVEYASKYQDKMVFVGSHPMAGSEKSGVENSFSEMFEGATCLVTPGKETTSDARKKVADFWGSLGAVVREISPEGHDHGIAFSSHLPHAAAYALAGVLEEKLPAYLFAGGFKDTTRIASSDAELWSEIFESNRRNVLGAIGKYKEKLTVIEEEIQFGSKKSLLERLDKWRKLRDELV
jgi:prephenate dehydrogenase